ncbi:DUF4153 domain-containing protein [Sphingobium nicotianae]|uniref:DUF4153 domain-containing protein n=1 Tax=Sphingobium nicotianae TaxID=2782607 RepID=A0A9X1D9G9_9SPHN|nr:DUF4153 domain-containing protein [Sphingobium nicotianae]MBT2185691.1 DUF4153 domain-containing protein [Sphingobium nicotianae]
MASSPEMSETVWPLRTWVLAILGALVFLSIQQLHDLPDHGWAWGPRLVMALSVFLGVGGLAFGLAWQRGRLLAAIAVALLCGLVAGGTFIWNNIPWQDGGSEGWHVFCGAITAGCLLTLFQAAQDGWSGWPARWAPSGLIAWRREAILYEEVHGHLWTNALLLALSGAFMLLCIGIAYLMAEMFWLVKLDFLRVLLRKEWFQALMTGAPFGAALGLLRDRRGIITALQRVAMLVLRVLAPVVALAILVFLAALPFTGLAPLWDTGGTTPIMLVGAALALFLANAVVGDRAADESRSVILSGSAAALGLFLVPMIGIAAFSSGLRIQQYGLSPDRLWALTFVIVASIVAIAYAVAILGARGWFARLRRANLHLVFLIAAITLLLSTPLLSFDRIATAHQLARLSGGQVSVENFDYKGLWFEFGPPGKAAIRQLASSSDAQIRRYAIAAQMLKTKWDEPPNAGAAEKGAALEKRLTMLPGPFPLDDAMRTRLIRFDACNNYTGVPCIVRYVPGQDYMVVVAGPAPKCDRCRSEISIILRDGKGGWSDDNVYVRDEKALDAQVAAIRAGRVEMRPVQQRQLFIDGKPVGNVIPPQNEAAP